MKAINFVGGQVEDTLKMLPKGTRKQIDEGARSALQKSYEVAAQSRKGSVGRTVTTDRGHKVIATVTGALDCRTAGGDHDDFPRRARCG